MEIGCEGLLYKSYSNYCCLSYLTAAATACVVVANVLGILALQIIAPIIEIPLAGILIYTIRGFVLFKKASEAYQEQSKEDQKYIEILEKLDPNVKVTIDLN